MTLDLRYVSPPAGERKRYACFNCGWESDDAEDFDGALCHDCALLGEGK